MARINETRQTAWHGTCKWICSLTSAIVIVHKYGIKINVDVNGKRI